MATSSAASSASSTSSTSSPRRRRDASEERPDGAARLGVSHKTAPVAVRERLRSPTRRPRRFLRELVADDAAVRRRSSISTCNRTELYVVASDPVQAESAVLTALARRADIRPTELAEVMYFPRNCDAARQLYRVASGLESMIVGEAEVQGQVRRAYEAALAADTTGPLTNRLFTAALQTGRRVRSETKIGRAARASRRSPWISPRTSWAISPSARS